MPISPHHISDVNAISRFWDLRAQAAEIGGARLLTGDAGAGKTALLNEVAAEARWRSGAPCRGRRI